MIIDIIKTNYKKKYFFFIFFIFFLNLAFYLITVNNVWFSDDYGIVFGLKLFKLIIFFTFKILLFFFKKCGFFKIVILLPPFLKYQYFTQKKEAISIKPIASFEKISNKLCKDYLSSIAITQFIKFTYCYNVCNLIR